MYPPNIEPNEFVLKLNIEEKTFTFWQFSQIDTSKYQVAMIAVAYPKRYLVPQVAK